MTYRMCPAMGSLIVNLLASVGIDPVPSFAIREKCLNFAFGAIGADQNNAPAAIVLTARPICWFEVRISFIFHYASSHGRRGMSAIALESETVKVLTQSIIPVLLFRPAHPRHSSFASPIFDADYAAGRDI